MHTLCTQTGGVRDAAPGEDKQDVINEAGKQEIALTLVNRAEGLAQEDSSNMKALFVRYSVIYEMFLGCIRTLLYSHLFCVKVDLPIMKMEPDFLPVHVRETALADCCGMLLHS